MNMPEFFVQKWEAEQGAFSRVIGAIPGDQLAYKPHERSNSSGGIAWQLVEEQRALGRIVEKGTVPWKSTPMPQTLDEIIAEWDAATSELRKHLASVDESRWDSEAKMTMGESGAWSDTLGNMLWGFLLDMIHHRGQLSAYLRPMGAKVPSIYGPSADTTEG